MVVFEEGWREVQRVDNGCDVNDCYVASYSDCVYPVTANGNRSDLVPEYGTMVVYSIRYMVYMVAVSFVEARQECE